MQPDVSTITFLAFLLAGIVTSIPIAKPESSASQDFGVCDNSMLTLAGSLYKIDPDSSLTLSAFSFPLGARLYRRGLATGDGHVVWCCENSTTYITIAVPMQIWSDPGLDATNTLSWAIKDVEAKTFRYGLQRLGGGYWDFALDHANDISALDVGPSQNGLTIKHLTWPVLRDGLKALKDFIAEQNLTHSVRGLQFGIHSAHLGQVGKGQIA
ncbi:MAG: hypothetical protein Q9213_000484 [Squamulea squamosa]